MSFIELFLIAVSLAMDAFAVSVSNGLILPNVKKRNAVTFGLYFGLFQFFMPIIGYFLGNKLTKYVQQFDHWIAFILLGIIGFNMIKESFSEDEEDVPKEKEILKVKNMTMLAIATSIDALAVGVTFAFIGNMNIVFACSVIGIVAFILSYAGLMIKKKIGPFFKTYAERIGGLVLVGMGIKILVQHIFFGG